MKALVLHAVGDLRFQEMPDPIAKDNEVLVRVAACGVCGSDIPRVYTKGTYHFPTVCGHEFSGTVEGTGKRVTVFPLLWCGQCAACETGAYVQCENYGYLGSRNDGGFAELVAVPERNLLAVPDGVSLEEAAMTEPCAVALHALRRTRRSLVGLVVAVFGAGPIGLMVAQWARAMGAADVFVYDIAPGKLALARNLGFSSVFQSPEQDATAHVCVEAAGVPATLLSACKTVRRGGAVVLLGNPSSPVTMPAELFSGLMRREVDLIGTWNSVYSVHGTNDDWRTVLSAVASKRICLTSLITHRAPLANGVAAFEEMRDHPDRCTKVLILPNS